MHQWTTGSALGSHNHRDATGQRAQVVLVIRGDLRSATPTRSSTPKSGLGHRDRVRPAGIERRNRRDVRRETTGSAIPLPAYKARIDPDLHLIGFDLTVDEVRGDPRLDETAEAHAVVGDNIGWFFVIQEAVGEPRFGLDVEVPADPSPQKWDNLSWANLDFTGGQAVDVSKPFVSPPAGAERGGRRLGKQRRRHGLRFLPGSR